MAGIFVNVNDDIQNLRKLKTEINEVKKALKGINVTVDFDIKKDLEAQLRSLTTQYDALATKISETEGKIMLSTQRINETTNKIIEAQNKIVGSAQGQSLQQQVIASNINETQSVQAQAMAYDELKDDIDAVLGSRAENIKRMVEEQNAIRIINAELKQMEKLSGGQYSPTQLKRIEQLNDALLTHKAALSEVRQTLNNNAKMDNAAANSMTRLSQELGRMKMAYRELTEEEKNSPFGQALLASINQVDAKMKEMDASIGNFQRNVGNYWKSFNGLNVSVQQIVRELPSAAMGLNTFFLAISNNIPMLTDEIRRAKIANEELKASGQKGIPVWKQVASSLVSWQTALMVGISLLSIYGKDIKKWIANLFEGKDALITLEDAINDVNDALSENSGSYSDSVTKLKSLKASWEELSNSLSSKNTFIEQNKSFFEELGVKIKDVTDAENLFTKNTPAVIKALALKAKATAAYQLAVEKEKESFKKTTDAESAMVNKNAWDYWNAGIDVITNLDAAIQGMDIWNPDKYAKARAGALLLESDAAQQAADSYRKLYNELTSQANELLINAGFTVSSGGSNDNAAKALKDISSQILAIQKQNAQDEINLEEDIEKRRIKQIELDYENRMAEIEKFEKELAEFRKGSLTDEDKKLISDAKGIAARKKEQELNKNQYEKLLEQYRGYFEQRKAIEEKYDNDRKQLIKSGASKETLDENAYQKDKALQEIDLLFASREEEFQIWAKQVVDLSVDELISLIEQAEQEISKLESENPKDSSLASRRAKVTKMREQLVYARAKQDGKKDENPDPKAEDNWKELYNTLRKVERQFDEIGDAIGGTVGDIISAAGLIASNTISIIDGITTLTEHSAKSMDETTEAAGESMKAVEKASVILAIIGAALQISTKIASMFGADYSNYNKAKENYESYVEVLDNVINKQKELIETMTGKAAVEASEDALELIQKQAQAAKELGKIRLNSGTSAGSHSIGVRQRKNMSEQGWDEALDALGTSYYNKIKDGRMEGLFDLSVEQLEKLQMEAPTFWAQLDEDVRGYLEQIIESNEAAEKMKETLQETLTGLTFEDFSGDILESLYDVEKGAEDIFDDMSDYMRKSMIKAMYVKNYEGEMKKWYEQWSKAMEDGLMTTQEKESLEALKESIISGAVASAKQINEMFEYTGKYSQEATSKGFETMTQEQAGELNGRFAALQDSGEQIKNGVTILNVTAQDIVRLQSESNEKFSGMQDQLAIMTLHLSDINDNTSETVKHLKDIKAEISEVKENTKKL